MRLFYGGRASKDPPLTTIFLLVFVLLSHGVSGDETTTTEGATSKEATTTAAKLVCVSIAKTFSIDEIVSKCETDEFVALAEGQWFFLSSISKENVEKFLKEKKTMTPGIHIENRADIDILDLNELSVLSVDGRGGLHIVNTAIHTIKYINTALPKPKILQISGIVTVRGNKNLKQKTIDNLNLLTAGKGADIQSFGECMISTKPKAEEFKDCLSVYGHLEVDELDFTQVAPNFQPTAISGCLKIGEKSKVAENMFKELITNAGKNKGNNNCNGTGYMRACLKKEVYDKVGNAFQNGLEGYPKDVSKCDFTCTMEDLEKFGQKGCKTIKDDVKITDATSKEMKDLLGEVKTVEGNIIIRDTKLTQIDVFKNLETLIGGSNGPALQILNNKALKDINFPLISSIKGGHKTCVEIKGNGEYLMDNHFESKLKKIASKCDVSVDKVKNETRTFTEEKPVERNITTDNTNLTSVVKPTETDGNNSSKKEDGMSTGALAGIIIGVVVGIVIIVLVVGLLIFFVRRIGKKKNSLMTKSTQKGLHIPYEDNHRDIPNRVFTLASTILETLPNRLRQGVRTGTCGVIVVDRCPDGKLPENRDTILEILRDWSDSPRKYKNIDRINNIIRDYQTKYQDFYDPAFFCFLYPAFRSHIYTLDMLDKEEKKRTFEIIFDLADKDNKVVLCTIDSTPFEKFFSLGFKCKRDKKSTFSGDLKEPHPGREYVEYYTVTNTGKKQSIVVELHHIKSNGFVGKSSEYFEKYEEHIKLVHWAKENKVPFLVWSSEHALYTRLLYFALLFIFDYATLHEHTANSGILVAIILHAFEHINESLYRTHVTRFDPPDVVQAFAVRVLAYITPYIIRMQNQGATFKHDLLPNDEMYGGEKKVVEKKEDKAEEEKEDKPDEQKDKEGNEKDGKTDETKDEKRQDEEKKEETDGQKEDEKKEEKKEDVEKKEEKAGEKKTSKEPERKTAGGDKSTQQSAQTSAPNPDQKSVQKSAQKPDQQSVQKSALKTDQKSALKTDQKSALKTDQKSAQKDDEMKPESTQKSMQDPQQISALKPAQQSVMTSVMDPNQKIEDCEVAKKTRRLVDKYVEYTRNIDKLVSECLKNKNNKTINWKSVDKGPHLMGTNEQNIETVKAAFDATKFNELEKPLWVPEDRPNLVKEMNYVKEEPRYR